MFEITLKVGEQDLSPAYNHVHHAHVLLLLEKARLAFLTELGFPTEEYQKRGLFWVIASISVDYKREIRAGEIRVTCENNLVQDKTLILDQRIYNEKGKLAVEGTAHSMLLSQATQRSAAIPAEFREAVSRYESKGSK